MKNDFNVFLWKRESTLEILKLFYYINELLLLFQKDIRK